MLANATEQMAGCDRNFGDSGAEYHFGKGDGTKGVLSRIHLIEIFRQRGASNLHHNLSWLGVRFGCPPVQETP
jgi:hypothetical protein